MRLDGAVAYSEAVLPNVQAVFVVSGSLISGVFGVRF